MYTRKYQKRYQKKYQVRNKVVAGVAAILIMSCLTGCTSKDEIVLELEKQEEAQEQTVTSGEQAAVLEEQTVVSGEQTGISGEQTVGQEVSVSLAQNKIYVHICGAVAKPGVYELDADSRVYEGIEAAGGFTENACTDYVNQAELLQDGQKITIPTLEEAEQAKAEGTFPKAGTSSERADGRVNINTATESELCAINGIGEGRAAAIVKYRQENGNFASIEDIMKVSGIKEGTYEKIKDMITVK